MEKPRILIVEDEIIIAEDLRKRLNNLGYSVAAMVATGQKAIRAAGEGKSDLVLMDIVIKGEMDGIEAAGIIRRRYGIPVVYLTAYADETFLNRAKITEPLGYLVKPFEDRALHATIEMALYKHRMEQKLSESQRWFAATLRSIGDSVIATDEKGNVQFMNLAAQTLTGWQEEVAIGKPIETIFNIFKSRAIGEDHEPVHVSLEKRSTPGIFDYFILARDGKKLEVSGTILNKNEVEIDIEDTLSPIQDDDGISGAVMAFRDISERKRLEEKLWFTQFAVDRNSDAVFFIEPAGGFIYVNDAACRRLGYSQEELLTLSVSDIDHNFTPESWSAHWIELKQQGTLIKESHHHAKDGAICPVEISANYLEFDDREFNCAFVRDISERRNAEENRIKMESLLRRAQKMESIGTLAGGIAHDFNNILFSMIGYTELALGEVDNKTLLRDYLHEVMTAGQRARDLVQQILAFSRQADRELRPVQIKLAATEIIKLLRASLPATIEIHQDLKSEDAVRADPIQIHQLLMNLCTNAGHAMPKGGILSLELVDVVLRSDDTEKYPDLQPGPYLKLTVTDTGHGMPSHVQTRIFDPFFTTKGKNEGTGLGLSVVHGIVKSYGGTVTVFSEQGKGSVFEVFLPSIDKMAGSKKAMEKPLPRGTERILFVDDEEPLARLGKKLIESMGYDVVTVTSSLRALELFGATPDAFDLVITDMTMPKMTGDELAEEFLRIKPDIPIILCSGFSAMIDEDKATAMGIRAFIFKPILKREIAHAIRTALDNPEPIVND